MSKCVTACSIRRRLSSKPAWSSDERDLAKGLQTTLAHVSTDLRISRKPRGHHTSSATHSCHLETAGVHIRAEAHHRRKQTAYCVLAPRGRGCRSHESGRRDSRVLHRKPDKSQALTHTLRIAHTLSHWQSKSKGSGQRGRWWGEAVR